MNKFITITIDRELIKKYNKYYFKKHPKAKKSYFMNNWKTKKKKPKELYSVLSLNDILPISPPAYSKLKNQWKDFGIWLAKEYKLKNKKFTNGCIEYRLYNSGLAHNDTDNLAAKLLNDGLLVESGMFEDDSYYFVNPFISGIEVDRLKPRLEIRISILDDEVKDIYTKMMIHIKHFMKEEK